jgi:hypothetical protein
LLVLLNPDQGDDQALGEYPALAEALLVNQINQDGEVLHDA